MWFGLNIFYLNLLRYTYKHIKLCDMLNHFQVALVYVPLLAVKFMLYFYRLLKDLLT